MIIIILIGDSRACDISFEHSSCITHSQRNSFTLKVHIPNIFIRNMYLLLLSIT